MNAGISVGEHLVGEARARSDSAEVFSSCQNLIVCFFCSRCLRFRRNLADMFSFFIRSQHPLSAYCWARQEPGESRSKLLDAGVYRRVGAAEADFFLSYAAFGNLNVSKYVEHAEPTLCEMRWDYHVRALQPRRQICLFRSKTMRLRW